MSPRDLRREFRGFRPGPLGRRADPSGRRRVEPAAISRGAAPLVRPPGRARPGGRLLGHRGPHRRRAARRALLADAPRGRAGRERQDAFRGGGRPRPADRGRRRATSSRIVRRAAPRTRGARSRTGPDPKLPAEALVDEPGRAAPVAGPRRQRRDGEPRAGSVAEARRDLAATRRLEAPFVVLGLGPVDLSALSIRTASGVLRVVPGLDLEPGGRPVVDPRLPLPERRPAGPLAERDRRNRVASRRLDLRLRGHLRRKREHRLGRGSREGTGRPAPRRGRRGLGLPAAVPGIAGPDAAGRRRDSCSRRTGGRSSSPPENRLPAEQVWELGAIATTRGSGDVRDEGRRHSRSCVAVAPGAGPAVDVREGHAAAPPSRRRSRPSSQPIFAASRRKRNELRLFYVALVGVLRGGRRRGHAPRARAPPPRRARRRRDRLRTAVARASRRATALDEVGRLSRGHEGPRSPRALADRLHGGRPPSRADGRAHDAPGGDVRAAHAADRRARRRHEGLDLPLGARDPFARPDAAGLRRPRRGAARPARSA